jgi:hypothetical protein
MTAIFVSEIIRDLLIHAYTHDYYARMNFYQSRGMTPSHEDRLNASKESWKEANSCAEIFQFAHADMLKVIDPDFKLPNGTLTENEKKERERIKIDLGIIPDPTKEKP